MALFKGRRKMATKVEVKNPAMPTIDELIGGLEASATANEPAVSSKTDDLDIEAIAEAQAKGESGEPVTEVVETVEGADVEPVVVAPPKKDPQAARFAALARRDREARNREAELARKQEEVDTRVRQIEAREAEVRAAKRPLDILKAHGYSYSDATQDALGGYTPKEPDAMDVRLQERLSPVDLKLQELNATIAELKTKQEELDSVTKTNAQREVRQNIVKAAEDSGCEYITALGEEAYNLVQEVISEHWRIHKRILNYNEACGRVEAYYDDRVKKLESASKLKSRLVTSDPTKVTPKPSSVSTSANGSPKTLTQSLQTGTRAKPDLDKLSSREAQAYLVANVLKYE
jgi:hypothetical protein